jgi:hypothetical protein
MLQIIDPVRFDAFVQLMSQPDPPDLPHRGHVRRCEGDPNRRTTRLPQILMGWLQDRHLRVDDEDPLPKAVRAARTSQPTYSGLRVLRPTGTGGR